MAYASRSGRARTNPSRPEAFGVCDRCGIWYQRNQLKNQMEWRGTALLPTFFFVCPHCYDIPTQQRRAIVVPADPLSIYLPKIQDFSGASDDVRVTSPATTIDTVTGIARPNTNPRTTQDGSTRIAQPVGPTPQLNSESPGLTQSAVMPLQGTIKYGTVLALLSVTANGTPTVSVTTSSPHGLATGNQISAEGLTAANGFYNVTVTSATAFTYNVNNKIPSAALLQGGSRIITANVGLPLDMTQIPQTGV